MSNRKCFKDGCEENTPFGFRRAGQFRRLPEGKRGTLWACSKHKDEARERKAKAEDLK